MRPEEVSRLLLFRGRDGPDRHRLAGDRVRGKLRVEVDLDVTQLDALSLTRRLAIQVDRRIAAVGMVVLIIQSVVVVGVVTLGRSSAELRRACAMARPRVRILLCRRRRRICQLLVVVLLLLIVYSLLLVVLLLILLAAAKEVVCPVRLLLALSVHLVRVLHVVLLLCCRLGRCRRLGHCCTQGVGVRCLQHGRINADVLLVVAHLVRVGLRQVGCVRDALIASRALAAEVQLHALVLGRHLRLRLLRVHPLLHFLLLHFLLLHFLLLHFLLLFRRCRPRCLRCGLLIDVVVALKRLRSLWQRPLAPIRRPARTGGGWPRALPRVCDGRAELPTVKEAVGLLVALGEPYPDPAVLVHVHDGATLPRAVPEDLHEIVRLEAGEPLGGGRRRAWPHAVLRISLIVPGECAPLAIRRQERARAARLVHRRGGARAHPLLALAGHLQAALRPSCIPRDVACIERAHVLVDGRHHGRPQLVLPLARKVRRDPHALADTQRRREGWRRGHHGLGAGHRLDRGSLRTRVRESLWQDDERLLSQWHRRRPGLITCRRHCVELEQLIQSHAEAVADLDGRVSRCAHVELRQRDRRVRLELLIDGHCRGR